MNIDQVIVLVSGLFSIAFVYWFFLGKKEEVVEAQDEVDIVVEGGYSPSVISIPMGKTTKINFLRKDANSCLEEVVLSDFKVRKYLPLNQKVTVEITPEEKGEFVYSCGMNMFHGSLIVK